MTTPQTPDSSLYARRLHVAAIAAVAGLAGVASYWLLGIPALTLVTHAGAALAGVLGILAVMRLSRTAPADEPPVRPVHEQLEVGDRLRMAVKAAGMRLFDWNLENRQLSIDPSHLVIYSDAARASASDPDNFILHVLYAEDLEHFRAEMRAAVKHKTQFVLSYRVVHADGTVHPVQLHGQVSRGVDGRATRVLGLTIDMTAEVLATQRIHEQAREQKLAIDRLDMATAAAGIGIWDWDLVTDKLVADNAMSKTFGNLDPGAFPTPQEFTRRHVYAEDLPGFERAVGKALKYGTSLEHDYRSVLHDGSLRHTQLHAKIFRDADNRPLRFLGVTIDTTRMVEATQKIEQQAHERKLVIDRLDAAIQVAGIGLWDWDLLTNKLVADKYMASQFNCGNEIPDAREFIRKIIHPDDVAQFERTLARAVRELDTVEHEYRNVRPDGQISHAQITARIFRDEHGKPVRFLGVSVETTRIVEAARKLELQAAEQRQLLERLNHATDFAGIVISDWDLTTGRVIADKRTAAAMGNRDHLSFQQGRELISTVVVAEDRAAFLRMLDEAVVAGDHILHRYRIQRAGENTVRHMQMQTRIFRDAAGAAQRMLSVSLDITAAAEAARQLEERSEHERALRERLDLATRVAGIGVWDWDVVADRMTLDEQIAQSLGRSNTAIDRDAREIFTAVVVPEDRAAFVAAIDQALAHGLTLSHRYRVMLPTTGLRHVQISAQVFRDAYGRAIGMLGVSMDITTEARRTLLLQQQADEERTLRDRLNLATQTAGIGVWELDPRTGLITADINVSSMLGLDGSLDEPSLSRLIHPDDREAVSTSVRAAIFDTSSDGIVSVRHRIMPGDAVRHVQTHIRVFRVEDGAPDRILGVTWDVSAEVEHTTQLQQQAAHVQSLLDRLSVATTAAGISPWEFDLQAQRFLWAENRPVAFGLASVPIEDYSNALRKVMHADDRVESLRIVREAIASDAQTFSYRFRLVRGDGTERHMQSYAHVVRNEQGHPVRLLGATTDITNEVQTTNLLQRQAEQERALVERLNMATDVAGISSWEMDLVTSRTLWVENQLKGMEDTTGPDKPLELLGERLLPEDRHVAAQAITSAVANRAERMTFTYRARTNDDRIIHVESQARLIYDEHGTAVRALGVSRDVTREIEDSRRLEEQAQQQRILLDRLSVASEAAGICSFEIDMERGVFLWSENPIKALTEMSVAGMSLKDFTEKIVIPEDRHLFWDATRTALKEKKSGFSCRYRGIGTAGNLVHVQTQVRFVPDQHGRAVRLLGVSWDVTAMVEAAEQLKRQAEQERQLLDRLSIATHVADIATWEVDLVAAEFLWLENPLQAMSPATREVAHTLANDTEMLVPEDRPLMEQCIHKAMTAGTDRLSYRYRCYSNTGSIVHVQNYAKLILDEQGRPSRLLGASWDVTKEVEAADQLAQQAQLLKDAEHRLERASLSSSEGHWEWDLIQGIAWYSTSCHTLLGYMQGELPANLQASLQVMQHPDDVAWQRERFDLHLQQAQRYDFECRLRLKSGEYRWFRVRGTAERDANGRPAVMAGSIHDIHQQRLAEEALRLAQRRLERAINGTQDGLWELEADGSAWCSPRLGELLGYPVAQFDTSTNFLRMFLHPDDAQAVAIATQAHFQQELPYDVEIRLRTCAGAYRWYRARASAERDTNGRPLRMSGSLRDITDARAAHEELVRATAAAEAASSAKSEFLANVSHEIRTPMNGIIGMTRLLLDTSLDRTQADYAQTIRGSADSLMIVINDILDFSKIEAGKMSIDLLELNLRNNVEDVGSMMAFQAAAKNLELVMHVHPDLPDCVIGDPQRIRQCLINLVGNAIKFTRTGEVVLEVRNVGNRDGKVLAQFEVRDTGIGIAPHVLQTLFQPFVQADSSTTRHFGGTGLGLSIVRRLVEMMGGAVGIESALGKGSVFWFTLPLEPAPATPALAAPSTSPRQHHRVLIVDDSETNRRVLAGQLMHAGYEVTLAGSGNEALQLLSQGVADAHPYDVVLADYQMQDMDGATLGERINGDIQLARARIVILTSLDRHGDIRRFASLGFAGYLTKPVRSRELTECLGRLLSRDAKEWHLQSQPIVTSGMLAAQDRERRYHGQVLLVEDNAVNQKVAVRFLERMGCQVRVADNGAEGLKTFREGKFDIVLMDLQMPIMDGLTATREIRAFEAERPQLPATPIIALTANAMTGQLERCLEAGMNAFLSKPLELARLHETLERFGLGVEPAASGSRPAGTASTPVDLARLREITEGDAEFAHELAATFITSGHQVIQDIVDAMAVFDRAALTRAAHKLKGASANIHAASVCELAHQLEIQAGSVDQPRLQELIERLHREFVAAANFLQEHAAVPAARAG